MALVHEDGTGKADAESFVSLVRAAELMTAWGLSWPASFTTDAPKETALRYASKWLSIRPEFDWLGVVKQATQALDFPRQMAWDDEGRTIDPDSVPLDIEVATVHLAASHAAGNSLNTEHDRGGAISHVQAGSVAVSFASWAPPGRVYEFVTDLVSRLTRTGGSNISRVLRA